MKKLLIVYLFFAVFTQLLAQENLVLNPSFETYTACPGNTGADVYKAIGWDNAKNTPDYFNICGTNSAFQTPKNLLGQQTPKNGVAYAGIITYDAGSPNYREHIVGTLKNQLQVGQKYFVNFYVSSGDSIGIVGYFTNNIGIRFSKTKYNLQFPDYSNTLIDNFSHIKTNNIISNVSGWSKITGSFIADSNYKYLYIGNFYSTPNTTITPFQTSNLAYYYIDEVCVSTDSTFSENYITQIRETNLQSANLIISPNPANSSFEIISENFRYGKIYNSKGQIIIEIKKDFFNIPVTVDVTGWPNGVYVLVTEKFSSKIIINH